MSDEKATIVAELIVGFIGLVIIYLIGMAWSWYFLREGTSTLGWIAYFGGGSFLFIKMINKTFDWFKKLFFLIKLKA